VVGPAVLTMVMSASNTPESGDTSTILPVAELLSDKADVELPHTPTVVEEDPLSILTVTLASAILSSPCADTL